MIHRTDHISTNITRKLLYKHFGRLTSGSTHSPTVLSQRTNNIYGQKQRHLYTVPGTVLVGPSCTKIDD